jgi:5-methyltetrahydrofolate--homocysteine methyltransferase
MEKSESSSRGKVLLATVKGDVHDIGKNLVDIILSNNGFEVVNLGIKVPSEQLIQAVREHRPDIIGLSGLLVKSAQQMILTAGDLAASGIETPIIVGGAALTRRFAHVKIAPAYEGLCTYAKDAMSGLSLVERILDSEKRAQLEPEIEELIRTDVKSYGSGRRVDQAVRTARSSTVDADVLAPSPPDLQRHVQDLDLETVWSYLNEQMLYAKHLGLKGSVAKLRESRDVKLSKLVEVVEEVRKYAETEEILRVRAVWQFFPAQSSGNSLELLDPDRRAPIAAWEFPRQPENDGLCLADYVVAQDDHVGVFVTTAGDGVRAQVEEWKVAGHYLRSHVLAAMALEVAEAGAEYLHQQLRADWGFPDPPETSLKDRLSARYRGKRYSFGYPACPDLAAQRELFRILEPQEIGVILTDGDMMDPEASVSALVFHHPAARYFGV